MSSFRDPVFPYISSHISYTTFECVFYDSLLKKINLPGKKSKTLKKEMGMLGKPLANSPFVFLRLKFFLAEINFFYNPFIFFTLRMSEVGNGAEKPSQD